MSEVLASINVTFDQQEFNLGEIYQRFAQSVWGLHQATQVPRFYKVYGHGDHTEFVRLVGDDTHPVRHMLHTTENIALPFVQAQRSAAEEYRFTTDDEAALLITALIHDVDECEHPDVESIAGCIVGDIPKFDVTKQHEENKRLIRERFVYANIYPHFPEELIKRIEMNMSHFEGDIVANAFNRIEQIGYVLSGISAAKITVRHLIESKDGKLDDQHYNFIRMASKVTLSWRSTLESETEKYPFVKEFLTEHRRDLRIAEKLGRIIV